MDGMYPPTAPPLKRKPINLQNLPPHIQAALAQGQPFTAEDGSVIYPDGTATGAGDSPDDFAMPPAMDYGLGGFNASPAFVTPDAQAGYPPTSPFDSPIFDAYKGVVERGMPGQPPKQDPLMDPLAGSDGTEPTRNVQLSVEGPRVGTFGAGQQQPKTPMYGGRIGRRRQAAISQPPRRRRR